MRGKEPGVYAIIDLDSEKAYIGSSVNLSVRMQQHEHHLRKGSHPNWQLQRAYNKGHQFEVHQVDLASHEEVLAMEQTLIDEYYDQGILYNIARDVGPGNTGIPTSEETRQKLSEITKKQFENPERRLTQSNSLSRYYADPDNKAKMIEAVKQAASNPAFKASQSEKAKQQWADPERRKVKAEQTREYLSNPENSEKVKAAREKTQRRVTDGETIFPSVSIAAAHHGLHKAAVSQRIKSKKWSEWDYV